MSEAAVEEVEAPTPLATGRVLVVTGDDFGLTPGVTAGILHAHRHGVLTNASLMAGAMFAAHALQAARETPSLSVGVHLVLTDGRPVRPPRDVPTLAGPDGRFDARPAQFVRRWMAGSVSRQDVERELRAQIEVLLEAGHQPTHLDSHKHVHMWPPVFEQVARLAKEYGIPYVRLAVERPVVRTLVESRDDRRALRQALDNALMAPMGWVNRRALARHGLRPAWFLGRACTGLLSPRRLERALSRLPSGRAELMTHPGYVDDQLAGVRTRLRAEREAEVALLCSAELRATLNRYGIRLALAPRVG